MRVLGNAAQHSETNKIRVCFSVVLWVKKQSRKTHLLWSLPISSLLCTHEFYLETHNSHASCPSQMVSGKCNSPQISPPDVSFLCQVCPHTGEAKHGASYAHRRIWERGDLQSVLGRRGVGWGQEAKDIGLGWKVAEHWNGIPSHGPKPGKA